MPPALATTEVVGRRGSEKGASRSTKTSAMMSPSTRPGVFPPCGEQAPELDWGCPLLNAKGRIEWATASLCHGTAVPTLSLRD